MIWMLLGLSGLIGWWGMNPIDKIISGILWSITIGLLLYLLLGH